MIAPCEMQLMFYLCVVLKIKRHGSDMEPTEVGFLIVVYCKTNLSMEKFVALLRGTSNISCLPNDEANH